MIFSGFANLVQASLKRDVARFQAFRLRGEIFCKREIRVRPRFFGDERFAFEKMFVALALQLFALCFKATQLNFLLLTHLIRSHFIEVR